MYIKSRIERIYREITELKKILILEGVIDKEKRRGCMEKFVNPF